MNIFHVTSDPEAHRASCVMRYRLRAACAMVFSLSLSWASWREIGRPFPGPPDPLNVVVGQVVFAAALVYLFIAFKCAWERLWLGPVAAAIAIGVVEMFGPGLVSHVIDLLRVVSLVFWLWSLVVSAIFVVSAFGPGRARQAEEVAAGPSGMKVWRSFISKRPLILAACYLAAAVALDWGDLYRRHVAHPWNIVGVDVFFEIFLCSWAAVLTEMVIRFATHHSMTGADPPSTPRRESK